VLAGSLGAWGVEAGACEGAGADAVLVAVGLCAVLLATVAAVVAALGSWVVSVVTCWSWVAATLGVSGLAAGARSAECTSRALERVVTLGVLSAGLGASGAR
jgi:hypothetical protein